MSDLKVRQHLKIKRIESFLCLTTPRRHSVIMSHAIKLMGHGDIANCGKKSLSLLHALSSPIFFSFHFYTTCSGLSHKVSRRRCISVSCEIPRGSLMGSVFCFKAVQAGCLAKDWGQFVKHCLVPSLIYGVIEHLYFITCRCHHPTAGWTAPQRVLVLPASLKHRINYL